MYCDKLQGSVATHLGCIGKQMTFWKLVCQWKKYENGFAVGEVTVKNKVSWLFFHSVENIVLWRLATHCYNCQIMFAYPTVQWNCNVFCHVDWRSN